MENKEEMTSQFDAYLRNELDASQMEAFEASIEKDKTLKEAFTDYKNFTEQLENAFFKAELAKMHGEAKPQKGFVKYLYPLLGVAAVAILVVFFNYFQTNNQTIYTKSFVVDPGLPTVMGDVGSLYQFNDAMVNYKLAEYETAIEKWTVLLDSTPKNDTLNYYIGVSYLNLDAIEQANLFLQNESVLKSPRFQKKAYFYLGLIAIKKDQIDEAKKLLKQSNLPKSKAVLNQLK